jgi:opacity protein-like surface antigen
MTISQWIRCLNGPALFFLLLVPNAARAQTHELWFNMGVSFLSDKQLGSPSPDGAPDDVRLGDNYRFGFRFDFAPSGHWGHELQYGYTRTTLNDATDIFLPDSSSAGMAIHQWGYNVMYYVDSLDKEAKVRPFVTAGVHVSDFVLPGSAAYQGSSFRVGVNYGGGVKMRLSTLLNARFDFRQYDSGKPNWQGLLFHQTGLIHQTEISAGLGVCF